MALFLLKLISWQACCSCCLKVQLLCSRSKDLNQFKQNPQQRSISTFNNQTILLQMMSQAQGQHRDLIQSIEGLPAAPGLSPLDQDLLMLKATSMATMNCLNECLHILHLQQVARQRGSLGGQWFIVCLNT